ncbi:MAG: hypothetical protein RMJ66_05245 [Bacteroidia bacterium]|nr:hypothetical protein [Bacteroidia bacterium]
MNGEIHGLPTGQVALLRHPPFRVPHSHLLPNLRYAELSLYLTLDDFTRR